MEFIFYKELAVQRRTLMGAASKAECAKECLYLLFLRMCHTESILFRGRKAGGCPRWAEAKYGKK